MSYKFNPFTGTFDDVGPNNGNGVPGGSNTEIQYNDSGSFAGSADLTWDDTGKELGVGGDINLDDGGTYTTTLQLITPTANRTISFPDATGTVGLVAGSSGQLVYNNAGLYSGAPSTSVGATGDITLSLNGAADTPPLKLTGTWFSGGTSTTTKPQLLIEPTGTTSTAWSTGGTGLGVNAPSGFGGNLLDLQVNGTSRVVATGAGFVGIGTSSPSSRLHVSDSSAGMIRTNRTTDERNHIALGTQDTIRGYIGATSSNCFEVSDSGGASKVTITNGGSVGIGTTSPTQRLQVTDGTLSNFYIAPGYNNDAGTLLGVGGAEYLSFATNGLANEQARLDSSGRLLVGTSSAQTIGNSQAQIEVSTDSASGYALSLSRSVTDIYGPQINFRSTRGTAASPVVVNDNDQLGSITFYGYDGTDSNHQFASITALVDGTPGNNDCPGRLVFSTTADGASSPTPRLIIGSQGFVCPDQSSYDNKGNYQSTTVGGFRWVAGATATTVRAESTTNSTSTRYHQAFANPNGTVGSISTSASATAYNTSSDYRLKENVTAVTDGITRLQQLKPSRFNFIADPTKTVDGFLAHEVQAIVPEAITGEKDAVDDEGNPQYQGIDQSKLVPLLTAALQEAVAKIESLEARLTAAGI